MDDRAHPIPSAPAEATAKASIVSPSPGFTLVHVTAGQLWIIKHAAHILEAVSCILNITDILNIT